MDILSLIGWESELFCEDIAFNGLKLQDLVAASRFLVIGGSGSIGQAVTREIFIRDPQVLHVVDISENNMVELVRDLRSTEGYVSGDFKTFSIDCGSVEFEALMANEGPYDYVFNLSALKHVRSESDPYTLMRMVMVNVFNTIKTLQLTSKMGAKKYFCVSTDKAANPVNMMGASKRIMEMFLMRESLTQEISMARFANVAFSDGSLLHGFNQRFNKKQNFFLEAFKLKKPVVDTTGAGDAFNGALAVGLANDLEIKEALIFANKVAGISTTKLGAAASMPFSEEIVDN